MNRDENIAMLRVDVMPVGHGRSGGEGIGWVVEGVVGVVGALGVDGVGGAVGVGGVVAGEGGGEEAGGFGRVEGVIRGGHVGDVCWMWMCSVGVMRDLQFSGQGDFDVYRCCRSLPWPIVSTRT